MLTKRIIPCLDIKDGRTVKGVNFENIRDAGDPVELGALYAREGADELVFLDITATNEKRKTLRELVNRIAHHINIPFTVGGGISSVEDVSLLLQNGADKISVNTSAFRRPELLTELAREFGSQCVVLAIDTRQEEDGNWYVYQYLQGDSDITANFSGYLFKFTTYGTVTGTKNGVSSTGTWSANVSSRTITSGFPSAGPPVTLLNGIWKIKDSGTDFVLATYTDTTTQILNTLQLRKQ